MAALIYTESMALEEATRVAQKSPCAKSQRGVVIFHRDHGLVASGFNEQPSPFRCDGSEECRENCNKLCVHAESAALHELSRQRLWRPGLQMLHVKVKDQKAVPSGNPSCWQCSREILKAEIEIVWLLQATGLTPFSAFDFHLQTITHCGILPGGGMPGT